MSPAVEATATLFVQLALVLLVARALGRVAALLGLAPVVGELLTGVVLGPSLFGLVAPGAYAAAFGGESAGLAALGGFGLVLLLVLAGVETDIDVIRERIGGALAVALGGILLPFALGFALGLVVPDAFLVDPGQRLLFAAFLATALSISAVPVVTRILTDLDAMDSPVGQTVLAVAMLTDLVGWLLIAVVAELAETGTASVGSVARPLVVLLLFALLAFIVGRRAVEAVLARVPTARTPTLSAFSVTMLAAVVAVAVATAVGLEAAVGAFVAGLVLGRSRGLDHDAIETIELFTLGFFAPLFFGTAGLQADLTGLAAPGGLLVGAATFVVAVVGKFGGAWAGATLADYSRWEAVALGAGLNARGAMEIVVAVVGLSLGVIGPVVYTAIVLTAVLTSVMASPVLELAFDRLSVSESAVP
jgi:Kef-type K+ transport system membrane component KefB